MSITTAYTKNLTDPSGARYGIPAKQAEPLLVAAKPGRGRG